MKNIWKFAIMAICAIAFVACSDDNEGGNDPAPKPVTVTGVYVLSEGNYYSMINGDLTSYDPATSKYTNGLFASVNGRALGGTANDGIVYGSMLYICNTDENVIEVADAKTAKSIKQIALGGARCVVADGGYLYVTSFTGAEVAKIDTTKLEIVSKVTVGDNPEDMVILNGTLYVANSGYGYGNTVSKIDLAKFEKAESITVPTNPVELFVNGTDLYLLCSGAYKADYSGYEEQPAVYEMTSDGKTTKIADATIATIGNGYIYLIDNNYYSTTGITYSKYDLAKKEVTPWELSNLPYSPYAVAVNPANGDIYVTSHNSATYEGYTYADYKNNGYTIRYDKAGSQLDQFITGVSAGTIIFY